MQKLFDTFQECDAKPDLPTAPVAPVAPVVTQRPVTQPTGQSGVAGSADLKSIFGSGFSVKIDTPQFNVKYG